MVILLNKQFAIISKNILLTLIFLCGIQFSWADKDTGISHNLNEIIGQQIPISEVKTITICLTEEINIFDFPVFNAKKNFEMFSRNYKNCIPIVDKEEVGLILNYTEKINIKSEKYAFPLIPRINIRFSALKEQLWLSAGMDKSDDLFFQGFGSINKKIFYFNLNYLDLKGILSPYFKNHKNFISLYKEENSK